MPSDPDQLRKDDQVELRGIVPGKPHCMEQLERLVVQGALSPEARGYALLSYLIEHYLASGPNVPIKAYAIALDVLGRGPDFDPAQNSIVRVEIGRLRNLLEMYYLGPGRQDPVLFKIPKGQTHLEVRFQRDKRDATTSPSAFARAWSLTLPALRNLTLPLAAAASLVIATLLLLAVVRPPGETQIAEALNDDYPRVFVYPFSKDPSLHKTFPGNEISSFLSAELSAFRSFRVISPLPATSLPVRPRDYVLAGVVTVPDEAPIGQVALTLRLQDGLGTVLWTDSLSFATTDPGQAKPMFDALSQIASTLGGALGVIDSDGRARLGDEEREWAKGDSSDFRCILRWQSFDLTKDPEERQAARTCLEDRAANDTPVGQIWSAMAFLQFLDWTEAGAMPGDPMIEAALAAANRALLLDPSGPDGYEALGSILTGLGRLEEAQEVLTRALEVNPSNLDTAVKLGWLDCLAGDWETGTERIGRVAQRYSVVPGWYRLPLALNAFYQEEAAEMLTEAKAIVASGDHRGLVLALIAARLLPETTEAERQQAALAATGRTVAKALDEIEAVFPHPEIMAGLRQFQ